MDCPTDKDRIKQLEKENSHLTHTILLMRKEQSLGTHTEEEWVELFRKCGEALSGSMGI